MSLICPEKDDIFLSLLTILPRGRAWQTHDGAILADASVIKSFWSAMATIVADAETAICKTFDEFFCATADDDLDLWLEEYGLPDECSPWGDDLCAKVASLGGTSIAYYTGLAAALGYAADMRWLKGDDEEFPGVVSTLHIVIDAALSAPLGSEIELDTWELPDGALGPPDLSLLICAFDRIIPAHCAITYEII